MIGEDLSPRPPGPNKELASRAACFQSLTVVLQPSHSCSNTSFSGECKSSNGSPTPGIHLAALDFLEPPKDSCPKETIVIIVMLTFRIAGYSGRTPQGDCF